MNDLILYTTEDGRSQIELRADLGTVWLSQLDMAELFQTSKQNVAKHLKAIFGEQELSADAVVDQRLATAADGKNYRVAHYNLDAILAVGYRVRSPRGVQFRRWASTVLKEYLAKGFVMDDERLKNPDGRPDYFDEMLARIRDIRASKQPSCAPSAAKKSAWAFGARTWNRSSSATAFRCSPTRARPAMCRWKAAPPRCTWTTTNAAKRKKLHRPTRSMRPS